MRNKFFILSLLVWLIPFCGRIPLDISCNIQAGANNDVKNSVTTIYKALQASSSDEAFVLVFKNNMKGCIINICGGVSLGVCTIGNLAFNGFVTSDMFMNSYEAGYPVSCIVRTTLPHSFELIGFWLSGAIGFMIAYQLILFMKGSAGNMIQFAKRVSVLTTVVFLIMLCAAYVETHISVNMV